MTITNRKKNAPNANPGANPKRKRRRSKRRRKQMMHERYIATRSESVR